MNSTRTNHALQRTRSAVTVAASGLRLSAPMQPPRQLRASLSLRSLGDSPSMQIKRIQPPVWARTAHTFIDGLSAEAVVRLDAARDAILSAMHLEVAAYLSDPDLTSTSTEEFPSTERLTGDYYIGDMYYGPSPKFGCYRVSVMARCLAHPLPGQSEPDDYLGLDVWLESSPNGVTFSSFRNTDSSSI